MLTTKHASIALLTAAAALTLVLLGGALAHADDLGFFGEAIFDRLDTNHDGVISPDEALAARGRLFDSIDADHDGIITAAEFEAAKASARSAGRGGSPRSQGSAPRCRRQASASPSSIKTTTAKSLARGSSPDIPGST